MRAARNPQVRQSAYMAAGERSFLFGGFLPCARSFPPSFVSFLRILPIVRVILARGRQAVRHGSTSESQWAGMAFGMARHKWVSEA
jgi:hypothetical protein